MYLGLFLFASETFTINSTARLVKLLPSAKPLEFQQKEIFTYAATHEDLTEYYY